jgi:hypothetical protein
VCANQNTPNDDFLAIPDCGHPLVSSSSRRLDDLLPRRTNARTSARLRVSIGRWRDELIDLDTAVDDARRHVNAAVEQLQTAVRERDRARVHLTRLVEWLGCESTAGPGHRRGSHVARG